MRAFFEIASDGAETPRWNCWLAALTLGAAVFLACLLGIHTRPIGFLASIWPANALMLGILLRLPEAARWPGWLFAVMGFMAADLLTGASLLEAFVLNGANLLGVAAAYALYRYLPVEMRRLNQPIAMLYLVLAAAMGSAAAGVVGGIANPLLFGG